MANQTYAMVITGNAGGQFVQNILHFRMDDDSFTNRLLAAKALVDGWLGDDRAAAWLALHPDNYALRSVKCRRVTNGGGPEWIDVSTSGDPGSLGSGMQMAGAGPVILWHTDGGARRIGKTFISGISPDYVDGGEITNACLAFLQTAATDLRASFPASGGSNPTVTMCIPRSNDPATRSLIVGHIISKDVGTQRRRQLPV